MEKARLGFKIYSLDNELLVDEDEDFVRKDLNKALTSLLKARARKLRNWNNHKEQYNAQRRERARSIEGRYHHAKRKAVNLGYGWDISFDEWVDVWVEAGFVIVPGTVGPSNQYGERVTAYSMRGPNKYNNTFMARLDTDMPWTKDNSYIVFRGEPLIGSKYHAESLAKEREA